MACTTANVQLSWRIRNVASNEPTSINNLDQRDNSRVNGTAIIQLCEKNTAGDNFESILEVQVVYAGFSPGAFEGRYESYAALVRCRPS
jgi:hypothetical protein